ncbi:MAG: hypothetical protein PHG65_11780, partial [Kiritimatiellae bacterium]|nr:hypothetical protein [Kiritimatiellia bacterium]
MRSLWPIILLSVGVCLSAVAGPYAPAVTNPLTTAYAATSTAFLGWASGWTNYVPGIDEKYDEEYIFDPANQHPNKALGSPGCSDVWPYDIITLGGGGSITLTFDLLIADGGGADFAVFENSLDDSFLELAWVEVSSDGVHYFRLPAYSLTDHEVPAFPARTNGVDATDIHGLAGKYRAGYGTPFDLAELPDSPLLDKQSVRFVRIVDLIGDGRCRDTLNRPIYDPYPTVGTPGFDLDAVGIIHTPLNVCCTADETGVALSFNTWSNRTYLVQWSDSLCTAQWTNLVAPFAGNGETHVVLDESAAECPTR